MGKRLIDLRKKIKKEEYSIDDAVKFIKENAKAKFDESIDIAVNLNIDTKKTDQNIRGSASLPHGTGRKCVIAVFAKDDKAEEAKKAGADIIGAEDLIKTIESGEINFDTCIATPDLMSLVGKVARILGPKGLMPNPKLGTVTNDLTNIINSLKKGRVNFKNDKTGIVQALVGKASFKKEQIIENINSLLNTIKNNRPTGVKGNFFKNIFISSTQGVSIMIKEPDKPT